MEIDPTTIDWSFVLLGTITMLIISYVIYKVGYECGRTDEALKRDKLTG